MRTFTAHVNWNGSKVLNCWWLNRSNRHYIEVAGKHIVVPEPLVRFSDEQKPYVMTGLNLEIADDGFQLVEIPEDEEADDGTQLVEVPEDEGADTILVAVKAENFDKNYRLRFESDPETQVVLEQHQGEDKGMLLVMRAGQRLTITRTKLELEPERKEHKYSRTWYGKSVPGEDRKKIEVSTWSEILYFDGTDLVAYKDSAQVPASGWVQLDSSDPSAREARELRQRCDDDLEESFAELDRERANATAMKSLIELVGVLTFAEDDFSSQENRDQLTRALDRADDVCAKMKWRQVQKDALQVARRKLSTLWSTIDETEECGVSADDLSATIGKIVRAVTAKIHFALRDAGYPATTIEELLEEASKAAQQSDEQPHALPAGSGDDPVISAVNQSVASTAEQVEVPR